LLITGQPDAAMTAWRQAAALDGRNPLWSFQIGKLSIQQGRWQDAIGLLESVLRDQPGHVEAMTLLAVAQTHLGRLDEAEQLLNQARQLKPDDRLVLQAMLELEATRRGAAPIGPMTPPGVGGSG
jgi:Flp pilus assembly protein TadD